jgi:hypothetical protein
MVKKWIQKAKVKKGALHRQLGVPENEDIPISYLLGIERTQIGKKVTLVNMDMNKPNKIVKVTPLLKHRVQFALNVKRSKRK